MGKKNNSAGDIDQIGVIKTITVYILCSFGRSILNIVYSHLRLLLPGGKLLHPSKTVRCYYTSPGVNISKPKP